MHGSHDAEHAESHDGAYWKLFGALAVLTVVELSIPSVMSEPRWLLVVALMFVAALKAAGVALYYMHVKYEKPFVALLAFAPIICVGIFFFLIMSDITEVDQGGWTFSDTAAEASHNDDH